MLHPQGFTPFGQPDQAVDVGVLAGIQARILAMLGKDFDALRGGVRSGRSP